MLGNRGLGQGQSTDQFPATGLCFFLEQEDYGNAGRVRQRLSKRGQFFVFGGE